MQIQILYQTQGNTRNFFKKSFIILHLHKMYQITSTIPSRSLTTVRLNLCKFNKKQVLFIPLFFIYLFSHVVQCLNLSEVYIISINCLLESFLILRILIFPFPIM